MRVLFFASAIALVVGSTCARAETMHMHSAGGPTPQSLAASAKVPSTSAFINTAAAANQFEIVSSRLALLKTFNPKIRAFAAKMVEDHTLIGKNFVAALGKADTGITPLPGIGNDLGAIMTKLRNTYGPAFEAEYVAAQTKGHQAAVGLFAGYAKGGANPVMKAFAKSTLPTIEMHLAMCYELAAALKK
jgi:putative membrane protein